MLLNITGDSVARSCRVPDAVLPARVNQHVAIIRPSTEDFDPRFVGYFLISPIMQDTMLSLAGSGGTRKALTKDMIERFEVPRPPRPIQERIADVLSTYDNLIEINQRRMALLGEAAQQLYREWFVRLRFPGHEHTAIKDGVPAGWERTDLAAACESLEDGDWIETKDQGGEDYRLLQISNIGVNEFIETGNFRYIQEDTFSPVFLAVRELKIQGVRVPHYNRRADLVGFVNGLPFVFIELKAVYKNIRTGFDENLTDYLDKSSIGHAFHHNAFLVVSNGDHARYGSITSKWEHFVEWKRNDEKDKARVDAEALLDGMLGKERLLDLMENFILFDDSRAGGTRKIVARNHQVLGVNNAVASVQRQEELKREFPPEKRFIENTVQRAEIRKVADAPPQSSAHGESVDRGSALGDDLPLLQRAHPDLGRLGVFWHTQGSGKSYSMAFFAEKVRRVVPGNFTFVVMTDREDLDDQIWRTFVGCALTDENTSRASSGRELKGVLGENHRFVFSLIHKFNQPVLEPYSERDDIIVISDEAHRTQAGKFARNMRLALPNASFIGFTGTPLFKHDHLTRRIFGSYVSRYDFKRSEEDQLDRKAGLREPRREAGHRPARPQRPDRCQGRGGGTRSRTRPSLLEKLLGQDYEVITADDRLDKLADDFVEHCSTRWETGKSMMVCIDKVTCARMLAADQAPMAIQAQRSEGADTQDTKRNCLRPPDRG